MSCDAEPVEASSPARLDAQAGAAGVDRGAVVGVDASTRGAVLGVVAEGAGPDAAGAGASGMDEAGAVGAVMPGAATRRGVPAVQPDIEMAVTSAAATVAQQPLRNRIPGPCFPSSKLASRCGAHPTPMRTTTLAVTS